MHRKIDKTNLLLSIELRLLFILDVNSIQNIHRVNFPEIRWCDSRDKKRSLARSVALIVFSFLKLKSPSLSSTVQYPYIHTHTNRTAAMRLSGHA
jgi:hypothetical protein